MLRHDLIHNPPATGQVSKAAITKVKADLEATPLESITEEELKAVRHSCCSNQSLEVEANTSPYC